MTTEQQQDAEADFIGEVLADKKGRKKKKVKGLYLTQLECKVLFKKYLENGFASTDADRKIAKVKNYLKELMEELEFKNATQEKMNLRFQEEYEKILADAEGDENGD